MQLLAGSVAPTTVSLSSSPNTSTDNTGGPLEIDPTSDALGLSPADFRRLVLGKEAASLHIRALIRALGAIRAAGHSHSHSLSGGHSHPAAHMRPLLCMTPAACRKDFVELADLAAQHYIFDRHYGSADPLYVAEEVGQQKSAELGSALFLFHLASCAVEGWGCADPGSFPPHRSHRLSCLYCRIRDLGQARARQDMATAAYVVPTRYLGRCDHLSAVV